MTTPATAEDVELDESELLHLALHAMGKDHHDESMRLLKRTLNAFPGSARAHYLLGAEHAQIGMYDRAVAEMTEAVQLDPALTAAHFQLGLLHVTAGRVREALAAWLPLDRLSADDPLRLFKSGMLHLTRNELALCARELRAGIAHNELNEALNNDMRRLLADVEQRQGGATAAAEEHAAPPPQVPPPTRHMLLSTYDRNQDDTAKD
jgi:tetratricopeptide (TPR) repeat protein